MQSIGKKGGDDEVFVVNPSAKKKPRNPSMLTRALQKRDESP